MKCSSFIWLNRDSVVRCIFAKQFVRKSKLLIQFSIALARQCPVPVYSGVILLRSPIHAETALRTDSMNCILTVTSGVSFRRMWDGYGRQFGKVFLHFAQSSCYLPGFPPSIQTTCRHCLCRRRSIHKVQCVYCVACHASTTCTYAHRWNTLWSGVCSSEKYSKGGNKRRVSFTEKMPRNGPVMGTDGVQLTEERIDAGEVFGLGLVT